MDEREAVQALKRIKKIFDKNKIYFWLNLGTLLGAIRENKFIDWDSDIDLATWYYNRDRMVSIAEELRKDGFDILFFNEKVKICKNSIDINIMFVHLCNGMAIHISKFCKSRIGKILYFGLLVPFYPLDSPIKFVKSTNWISSIHFILAKIPFKKILHNFSYSFFKLTNSFYFIRAVPSEYFTKLSEISFYNMKLKIPFNSKQYLTYLYGNWEIPDKEFPKQKSNRQKWQKRKGTYGRVVAICPKCNEPIIKNNPHTKKEEGLFKELSIVCEKCGHQQKEKIFILGTVVNNISHIHR